MKPISAALFAMALVTQIQAQLCPETTRLRGEKTYLLGVGISHYDFLPTLAGAEADVRTFLLKLANRLCVPAEHVVIADDATPRDRGTILLLFINVLKLMKKGDTLVFVFSGHGFEIDGEQFLAPRDLFFDEASVESLKISALSLPDLKEIVRQKGATDVGFILDVCRSFPPVRTTSRIAVLSASQSGQEAFEAGGKSVFLAAITERLNDPNTPLNTFRDLASIARSAVPKKAAIFALQQTPTFIVDSPPEVKKEQASIPREASIDAVESSSPEKSGWHYDHAVLRLQPLPRAQLVVQRN